MSVKRRGFSFGITSGIITTLGLMVGLTSGTESKFVVIAGILTIAIADAISDAFGMHISIESESGRTKKDIWDATGSTFISKFIFALSFLIPVMLFELYTAVIVSVVWGLLLINSLSYKIAKDRKSNPWKAIGEHTLIAVVVIVITYYVGQWAALLV